MSISIRCNSITCKINKVLNEYLIIEKINNGNTDFYLHESFRDYIKNNLEKVIIENNKQYYKNLDRIEKLNQIYKNGKPSKENK